jgi:Holliday junction resolvase RusA-like endonuclease
LIRLHIPGDPVGKGRPRFVRATGRTYTPKSTADYEAKVASIARGVMYLEPLVGPLHVEIDAVCARPATRPASVDRDAWNAGHRLPRIGKPDVDNVAKAVLDGLVKGRLLEEDTHVTRLTVARWYAARGEEAHVVVEVSHG